MINWTGSGDEWLHIALIAVAALLLVLIFGRRTREPEPPADGPSDEGGPDSPPANNQR
jgi:hypothetical protein